MEKNEGITPTESSVKVIAKKYHVSTDNLKTAILKKGISEGWLQDEFFR